MIKKNVTSGEMSRITTCRSGAVSPRAKLIPAAVVTTAQFVVVSSRRRESSVLPTSAR